MIGAILPLLTASCNTMQGIGRDISGAGTELQKAATPEGKRVNN